MLEFFFTNLESIQARHSTSAINNIAMMTAHDVFFNMCSVVKLKWLYDLKCL